MTRMVCRRLRSLALPLAALLAAACWRSPAQPEPFAVDRTSPGLSQQAEPLLLNDSITIYFSAPVQPLSVTEDSITMLDEAGRHVPGSLRVGANWVTFEPEPPLAADLRDGSFRPGATYRLEVAGSPRADAVRATDGRRLEAPASWSFRVVDLGAGAPNAVLRPPAIDVPFLLRTPEVHQELPVDAPRLRMHFTSPLLPTRVSPDALTIRLLRDRQELRPRALRVATTPRLDPFPGCTLEVDLGAEPRLADGGATLLQPGDWISVELATGPAALTDYAGLQALPGSVQWWNVVEGGRRTIVEWPGTETSYLGDDPLDPAFEIGGGTIRPRVRIEAGDGSLGVFRPTRDTRIRQGEAFDRGDGVQVQGRGAEFPFTVVDVPEGVTVTIDATNGPVRLLACGSVRIAGTVELVEDPVPLPVRGFDLPAADLLANATIALLTAGDFELLGSVRTRRQTDLDASPLSVLVTGHIRLRGELPFHTVLAVETPPAGVRRPGIDGPRGQTVVTNATFTYGVAAGADFVVRGSTPWRRLPADRDGGAVRLADAAPGLTVAWQTAPPDPVTPDLPDRRVGRPSQPQPVLDGDGVAAGAGDFVRLSFTARVSDGAPIPSVREVRLVDRRN